MGKRCASAQWRHVPRRHCNIGEESCSCAMGHGQGREEHCSDRRALRNKAAGGRIWTKSLGNAQAAGQSVEPREMLSSLFYVLRRNDVGKKGLRDSGGCGWGSAALLRNEEHGVRAAVALKPFWPRPRNGGMELHSFAFRQIRKLRLRAMGAGNLSSPARAGRCAPAQ